MSEWQELFDLTQAAKFVVQASSFEHQKLWEYWGNPPERARVHWVAQSRGWLLEVGSLDGRPICLGISGALINNQAVLFYDATSEVVDWVQVELWFREHCWPTWDHGTRRAHCDAMNFHHCVLATEEIVKDQELEHTTK